MDEKVRLSLHGENSRILNTQHLPTLVNEESGRESEEEEGARCKRVNLLTVGVYGDWGNRKPRDYSRPNGGGSHDAGVGRPK